MRQHASVREKQKGDEFKSSRANKTETIEMQQSLMGVVVHSADLSNMTLPFEQFRKWGLMCVQEFDDSF